LVHPWNPSPTFLRERRADLIPSFDYGFHGKVEINRLLDLVKRENELSPVTT
jgi:hypothetical protein